MTDRRCAEGDEESGHGDDRHQNDEAGPDEESPKCSVRSGAAGPKRERDIGVGGPPRGSRHRGHAHTGTAERRRRPIDPATNRTAPPAESQATSLGVPVVASSPVDPTPESSPVEPPADPVLFEPVETAGVVVVGEVVVVVGGVVVVVVQGGRVVVVVVGELDEVVVELDKVVVVELDEVVVVVGELEDVVEDVQGEVVVVVGELEEVVEDKPDVVVVARARRRGRG